jgi:hypothetical protein
MERCPGCEGTPAEFFLVPRGDKSSASDKQKRMADQGEPREPRRVRGRSRAPGLGNREQETRGGKRAFSHGALKRITLLPGTAESLWRSLGQQAFGSTFGLGKESRSHSQKARRRSMS